METFHKGNDLEKRIKSSFILKSKYIDKIPIVVFPYDTKAEKMLLSKNKLLIPKEFNMGQLIFAIRSRFVLKSEQAIILTVNGNLIPPQRSILEVYNEYQHEDGFLYVHYMLEKTFG